MAHLRRLDLALAVYATCTLALKQRWWPKARQALTEAPRKRVYALEYFQPSLAQLMNRLRLTHAVRQGASNALF